MRVFHLMKFSAQFQNQIKTNVYDSIHIITGDPIKVPWEHSPEPFLILHFLRKKYKEMLEKIMEECTSVTNQKKSALENYVTASMQE